MSAESLELIVGRRVLKRFREGNADRRAQGERLQAAIRKIDESHVGVVPIRADAVLALLPQPLELGRSNPPALRTVKRHLSAMRAARRRGMGC
jgi:hypothetical protein